MNINDAIVGVVGTAINDGLAIHYGKTATESLHDAEYRWLVENGATPSQLNDMWYELLRANGYTGSINDMLLQFWLNGGVFAFQMSSANVDNQTVTINFSEAAFFADGVTPIGIVITNVTTAEAAGIIAHSGNTTNSMEVAVSWVAAPAFGDLFTVEYQGGGFILNGDSDECTIETIVCHNVLNIVPENTVAPEISGTGAVGTDLVCFSTGAWTGQPDSFEYSWSGDGYGFGTDTYTVESKDVGIEQDCRVQARNQFGVSPWVHSNAIEAIDEVQTPALTGTFDIPDGTAGDNLGLDLTLINTGAYATNWEWNGTPPPWAILDPVLGFVTGEYEEGSWTGYSVTASNLNGSSESNPDSVTVDSAPLTLILDTDSYFKLAARNSFNEGGTLSLDFRKFDGTNNGFLFDCGGMQWNCNINIYVNFQSSMSVTIDGVPITSGDTSAPYVDGEWHHLEATAATGIGRIEYFGSSISQTATLDGGIKNISISEASVGTTAWSINSGDTVQEAPTVDDFGAGDVLFNNVVEGDWVEDNSVVDAPDITGTLNIPDGITGRTIALNLNSLNTGGLVESWAWSGTPPPWANLDTETGSLTGTYLEGSWAGYSVIATNAIGNSQSNTDSVTVVVGVPFAPPAGEVGTPYSYTNIQGMSAPYSLPYGGTVLPNGLTLNTTTGEISGTPILANNFPYVFIVGSGGGRTNNADILINNPTPSSEAVDDTYSASVGVPEVVAEPAGLLSNDTVLP